MRKWIIACVILFVGVCSEVVASSYQPEDITGFISIRDTEHLERAFAKGTEKLLLPQGHYVINNPVVIDRPGLLYLFGAGRLRTNLIAKFPGKPLFIVRQMDRLAIVGLELTAHSQSEDTPLLEIVNHRPSTLEIQDSFLRRGSLHIGGPCLAIIQGSHFQGQGSHLPGPFHGIIVDHPQAELYMVAGNMKRHTGSHILQRAGHVEVYGTGMQSHGIADITLSTPSQKDAHIIAAVRSEGTKTTDASIFLEVPETRAAVNVLLKANNFTSPRLSPRSVSPCALPVTPNVFADYHAAGHIWLLGNFGHANVRNLVRSSNPLANVIAVGNAIKGCLDPAAPVAGMFDIPANAKLVDIDNLFDHEAISGESTPPRRRFTTKQQLSSKILHEVPRIPENANGGRIPRLGRPVIAEVPPKAFLRSVHGYADDPACKNAEDDTCYLQKALDSEGARLYFPAGDYKISQPLRLSQTKRDVGGMLAGAGSNNTRIVCSRETALVTDGMAYVTIQGITFAATDAGGAVVGLEWPEQVNGEKNKFVATQGNNFYDVRFEGGKYGLGIGRLSPRQCSENIVINSTFAGSHVGLAVGHYNALANTLHGVQFQDTNWNLGFSDEGRGGTWAVFEADAKGTKEGVIYRPGIGRNLYHNRFRSDGPQLLKMGWNSNESIVFFEHSEFSPIAPTNPYLDFNAGQGVIFLRSLITSGTLLTGGNGAASFIVSIYSHHPDFPISADQKDRDKAFPKRILQKSAFARYEKLSLD
jgi:hypothetical protein